jgi:hypothetical protein
MAFPAYRPKSEGGGLRVPEYKRGHHPTSKAKLSKDVPWNKGLTKNDHPSIAKMGFQPGHEPYSDWSKVNDKLANDPKIRERWLKAKKGQIPWNSGLTKDQYATDFPVGEDHGNWKGGHRGVVDTAAWKSLRLSIQRRDKFTCQECGDKNYKGRGSRIRLEVHHIQALCDRPDLALEPSNLILLCHSCHVKTHNYGTKAWQNKS